MEKGVRPPQLINFQATIFKINPRFLPGIFTIKSQFPAGDLFYYIRIEQRGSITKIIRFSFRDLSQNAPHDLAASGFWKSTYKLNFIRLGNRADYAGNRLQNVLAHLFVAAVHVLANYIGIDALSFNIVRIANNRTFHYVRVHVNGILHFGCPNAVAAYIEHIINAASDAVIALFIAQRTVAGKVQVLISSKIRLP